MILFEATFYSCYNNFCEGFEPLVFVFVKKKPSNYQFLQYITEVQC